MGVLDFIPEEVRRQLFDDIVELLREQAGKLLGEEVGRAIGRLHSSTAFLDSFDSALKKAASRFVHDYDDHEAVKALTSSSDFWKSRRVQAGLREIVRHPSSYLERERQLVESSFAEALPGFTADRTERAMHFFLRCLTEEVISIPELAPIYSVQLHKVQVEQGREMIAALRDLPAALRLAQAGTFRGPVRHGAHAFPLSCA